MGEAERKAIEEDEARFRRQRTGAKSPGAGSRYRAAFEKTFRDVQAMDFMAFHIRLKTYAFETAWVEAVHKNASWSLALCAAAHEAIDFQPAQ